MVDIEINILVKPDPRLLPTIYRNLGTDYAERVLPSISAEVIKTVVVCRLLLLI